MPKQLSLYLHTRNYTTAHQQMNVYTNCGMFIQGITAQPNKWWTADTCTDLDESHQHCVKGRRWTQRNAYDWVSIYTQFSNAWNKAMVLEIRSLVPWGSKNGSGQGGLTSRGIRKLSGEVGNVFYLYWCRTFMAVYLSKLIRLYTLYVCILLCVNYISLKLTEKFTLGSRQEFRKKIFFLQSTQVDPVCKFTHP